VAVKAVVFDLGETLIDERRHWAVVAEAAGVEPERMWSALGDVAARRVHHTQVYDDLGVEPPVVDDEWQASDLYPDAVACLSRLRDAGYLVGVAANQHAHADEFCRRLFPFDLLGISALWGVDKPAPEFFQRIAATLPCRAEEIAYVGDRVDNDVEPALAAGMVAVHLRRGPWGRAHESPASAIAVESLDELPTVLP
jgi:HAD superfamily hydrolase (TIGR01509 family)